MNQITNINQNTNMNQITNNNYEQHIINTPIMPKYEFNGNYNTLCITATVGLGKTKTLYNFLNYKLNNDYKSCLIISFRKILCNKYITDLPMFELYENIKESEIDSSIHPYVVCQVDSLKKIRGHYDFVIFDEFSYTMNHLVSSVESKKRCFDVIESCFNDNNHIIIMDALLDDEWINFIKNFNLNIKHIINEYSIHSEKKVYNYKTNSTSLIKEIRKSIEKKENIVIATNNKKMLRFIDNVLENNYKDIKKLMIKKESKTTYDLTQWGKVQVLGYTPTIVAGISYEEKHFDKCFGLFCNTSSTADMSFQQLFRVRNISSGEYHIACEVTGKMDYPETDEKIKNLILKEDKCLISGLDNINIDYIKKEIIEDNYFKLFNIVQKNRFLCNNNYNNVLINILRSQGINNVIEVNNIDVNEKKLLLMQKREFNKNLKEEEAERTANAVDATEEEIQAIKENPNKTDEEGYVIKKDSIKKRLKIKKVVKDTILKYGNKAKPLWNLSYIYSYTDYNSQLLKRINYDEKNIDINNDNTTRLGRNRKYETMYLCNHILNYFGFDGPLDKKQINIDKTKFSKYIIKYKEIIEAYFKCNSFDLNIFEKDVNVWYKVAKMYINSKLRSIYNISIIDNRKDNKWFIRGIDFWDDVVTYKNTEIISEIKENEINLFERIDNKDYGIIPNFMDILNGVNDSNVVINSNVVEEFNYYDNSNSPDTYIKEYNNKIGNIDRKEYCVDCNEETILGNIKCLKCKFKPRLFIL